MRTWIKWTLGVVLAIALLAFFFFSFKSCDKIKNKSSKSDSTAVAQNNEINQLRSDIEACSEYSLQIGDSLRWAQNQLCVTNEMIATLNDSIDQLNLLLDDCLKGKKKPAAKKATRTSTKQTYTPPAEQKQQKVRAYVPATSPGQTENTGLSGDQYVGVYNGSHGVTINDESQLVYFISNDELKAGEGKLVLTAPQLNNATSGYEFYWDAGKSLWIYESNTVVTIEWLEKGNPVIWSVYLGNNQQWGYTMFLPHEIVKTGSSSARSAIANGEVKLHNPNRIEDGASYVSKIQYRKK